MSDVAILGVLGNFIRHHRLEQNKTQEQVALEAGINRSTLSSCEQGKHSTVKTVVQLLRVLDQLHVLETFLVQQYPSPMLLAAMEQKARKRASRATGGDSADKRVGW